MILDWAVGPVGPLSDLHARRDHISDVISELVLLANNIRAGDKRGRAEAWKVLLNWDQQTSSV